MKKYSFLWTLLLIILVWPIESNALLITLNDAERSVHAEAQAGSDSNSADETTVWPAVLGLFDETAMADASYSTSYPAPTASAMATASATQQSNLSLHNATLTDVGNITGNDLSVDGSLTATGSDFALGTTSSHVAIARIFLDFTIDEAASYSADLSSCILCAYYLSYVDANQNIFNNSSTFPHSGQLLPGNYELVVGLQHSFNFPDLSADFMFTLSPTSVPEPATFLLLGLGLIGIVTLRRKFSLPRP